MLIWGAGGRGRNGPKSDAEVEPTVPSSNAASSGQTRKRLSAPAVVALLGVASVLVPTIGVVVGYLLQLVIPGCSCANESSMCGGCGVDALISFLIFGGAIGAFLAFLYVLFPALLLAGIVWVITFALGRFRKTG